MYHTHKNLNKKYISFFPLKFDHLIYKGIRHLTEKIFYRLSKSNENVKSFQERQTGDKKN